MDLLANDVFLLLLIVILGEAVGRIRVASFSFGSSAIIFVALLFGWLGYRLPAQFQTLGLVLFIYAVGLQAGPGFLASFRSDGLRLSIGALIMVATGFLAAAGTSLALGFDASTAAGLFAGAMTSTPGLAVAVEAAGGGGTAAAYGVAYTFGVVGVIVALKLLPRLSRVDVTAEEAALARELSERNPPVTFHHLEVTNENLFGRRIDQVRLTDVAPVTITRLLRRGEAEPILVSGETVLHEGDRLRVVGRQADLDQVGLFVGPRIDEPIEFERRLDKWMIVVSRPNAIGLTLGDLDLRSTFNVQVSRIERNGIELPANPGSHLHMGDLLHVVGDERSLRNVARLLGNDVKATYTASVVAILVGLFLGFLLGQVPLYLPWAGTFTLGTTGGVLLSGLLLSGLHKTGPFIWEAPATTNAFLRDLGLMLFLATVGTGAGATIVQTLAEQGFVLLGAGAVVTLLPILVAGLLFRRGLRMRFLRLLGVIAGGMTSTPGLAATTTLSETHHAAAAYATVYPVALIGMILFTRLLVLVLG